MIKRGIKGRFKFKSPFDRDNTDSILKVESCRSIKELLSSGKEDLYQYVYKKYGLSHDEYIEDMNNDEDIYILTNEAGGFYTIPGKYIELQPDISEPQYVSKIITINLGQLPVLETYNDTINTIKELVEHDIGIYPSVEVLNIGDTIGLPLDKHQLYEDARALKRGNLENLYLQLEREKALNEKLLLEIEELKCVIKKKVKL